MKHVLLALAAIPMVAAAQTDSQPFNIRECYRSMWADARSTPVSSRLGIGLDPMPLALRSSKLKANAKEKEALEFVSAAMQNCQKLDQPNRTSFHPLVRQLVESYEAGYKDILTKAYSGDLSWGAAISAQEEHAANYERRRLELIAMGEAQQAQQAQAEKQAADAKKAAAEAEYQRRAALRADFERQQRQDELARQEQASRDIANGLLLLNAARPQPMPNTFMRPPISCTSRSFNGTVHTDCN